VEVAAETTRIVVGDLIAGKAYSIRAGTRRMPVTASSAGSAVVTGVRLGPAERIDVSPAMENEK